MMKIRSVEVHAPPHHHPEDGTSSTYSIEEAPVDYERTIASLTQALTELQRELRDRTAENEALLATASSLSDSLQQSDQLLQDKSLECEQLSFKLQMVTFVERKDVSGRSLLDSNDQELDADLTNETGRSLVDLNDEDSVGSHSTSGAASSSSNTKSTHKKKSKHRVRHQEGKNHDKDRDTTKTPSSATPSISLSGPVSVDDFDESSPEIGPRQAHFYNIMLERDRALNAAKKFKKELKESKHKVKELQGKLDRSNLLVEISYHHEEQQKKKNQGRAQQHQELTSMVQSTDVGPTPSSGNHSILTHTPLEAPEKTSPSKRSLTRKWLRKNGTSARKHKEDNNNSPFQTLVTDEEKLPSKWNNTLQSSKNESAYLDAIAANDADRAGGHDHVRFQL